MIYYPRGSKYPNSRVSGTKSHSEYGFWDLKPYYLGTCTLSGYAYAGTLGKQLVVQSLGAGAGSHQPQVKHCSPLILGGSQTHSCERDTSLV